MSKSNKKPTDPINTKKEVKESNDPRIDQDVPGFPGPPSSEEDLKKKKPVPEAPENNRM
ncbi:MAG: hypothetical protein QM594_22880 [Niabella sp.]